MQRSLKNNCRKIFITIFLIFSSISQHAIAACSASAATSPALLDYGTYASQNVPAGGISPNGTGVSANFSVTCSIGLTLQLLSTTSWVRYTAQNALTMSNGTDTISYTMGSNSTYTPAITASGQSIGGPTGFQLLTLALLTSGRIDIPIYVKTLTTTLWPSAGTYTGTQSLAVDGVMCTGLGLPGVCLGTNSISSTVNFSLKLIVSKSCEFISTPALVDFGVVSFVANANTAQLSATLRCTNLEDYLLYVDNGNNYASSTRRMKSPAGNYISYDIFKPSSTTPLNPLNTLSRLGTGISENIIFPFKVTTGQSTPVAGVYTDNVRVVIEY
ncbi:MAG: SCPU domain-containing protein [Gammaproteobacteria bacterium]|nr:MAG: SCPU domain-containing protein [Gammaproteobacteria bacterium]